MRLGQGKSNSLKDSQEETFKIRQEVKSTQTEPKPQHRQLHCGWKTGLKDEFSENFQSKMFKKNYKFESRL